MRVFWRFLMIAVATAVGLLMCACAGSANPNADFSYAEHAFSLSVSGSFTRTAPDGYGGPAGVPGASVTGVPQSFTAEVTVGEPQSVSGGARDLAVRFTAPESLAGLTVTLTHTPASDGSPTRRVSLTRPSAYGAITLDDTASPGAYDGYLRVAEAWLPQGDIASRSATEEGVHEVAREAGDKRVRYIFAEGERLPIRVMAETESGRVEMKQVPGV